MSRNLILRITVAAIFIPAIIWIIYQGGWFLFGMLALFLSLGLGEYLYHEGWRPSGLPFWFTLLVALAIYGVVTIPGVLADSGSMLDIDRPIAKALALLTGFFLVSAMIFALGKRPPADLFARHSRLVWGLTYLSLTYAVVFVVGSGLNGFPGGDLLLFLFAVLWIGDTAAMGLGKAFGKHKLAPTVSPNKSVEGFLGGLLGALVVGVGMYFWKFTDLGLAHTLAIAVGAGTCGQLGDLVESMWKRSVGVKDSSAIIPGHGGVLDRFDSLLFAAPFMLAYFTLVVS